MGIKREGIECMLRRKRTHLVEEWGWEGTGKDRVKRNDVLGDKKAAFNFGLPATEGDI
jgi:hypothetical protein